MPTTDIELNVIRLLEAWLETKPRIKAVSEVYTNDYCVGWILIRSRNVCCIYDQRADASYRVDVLAERCHPNDQANAVWAKLDVHDPQFFSKLEQHLMFWI